MYPFLLVRFIEIQGFIGHTDDCTTNKIDQQNVPAIKYMLSLKVYKTTVKPQLNRHFNPISPSPSAPA